MYILLSNDDGVHAPGIEELAKTLSEIAEIDVIAPDRNKSGASNSLTLSNPLRPKKLSNGFISLEGTPTDCVYLALTEYLERKPDMVVSGINEGANLGDDTLYSGTVAAAMEGRILGIPSVAVSLVIVDPKNCHYNTAAVITKLIVEKLQSDPLPASTILNVNVPDIPLSDLHGFEVTRLGTRNASKSVIKGKDGHGRLIYWLGLPGPGEDVGPGTDFYAIESGNVSITPLTVDLTNYIAFDQVSDWTTKLSVSDFIDEVKG